MPLTVQQLDTLTNTTIDFRANKGKVTRQDIVDRPFLRDLRAGQMTFPGGKDFITFSVSGDVTSGVEGFTDDDEVTFRNPANVKLVSFPWREHHTGLSFSLTELKKNGIHVTDTTTGKSTSESSEAEAIRYVNLLEHKLEDMEMGYEIGHARLFWQDGASDPKIVPGVRSFILDNPTSALVVAGVDQASVAWWRNYAPPAIDASVPTNYAITKALQKGMKQQRLYGEGKAKLKNYAGSAFIEAYENELRAAGQLTTTGWSGGGNDMAITEPKFAKLPIEWDITLDELGLEKYMFSLDLNAIKLRPMEGEDGKLHYPARPENKFVVYRSKTWTGGLVCNKRRTSGVYRIQ